MVDAPSSLAPAPADRTSRHDQDGPSNRQGRATGPASLNVSLIIAPYIFPFVLTAKIERAIDKMVSKFELAIAEIQRAGDSAMWRLRPFIACTLKIGSDVVLTGHIDTVAPSITAQAHSIRVTGRSKTADLEDCTPDIRGGQFNGYKLDAIARAIAQPFGIGVVVQPGLDLGDPFPDATIERHETGFTFLERLARLRSVLLTDDALGRLVLTTAGTGRAASLNLPGNVKAAHGVLSGLHRFSEYRVKTAVPAHAATAVSYPDVHSGAGDPPAPSTATTAAAQIAAAAAVGNAHDVRQTQATTTTSGIAYDLGVPRYRPQTIIAETGLDAAGALRRAAWQAKYNAARSTEAHLAVVGYRQPDGALWQSNLVASVNVPELQLDADLLIASVTYEQSLDRGHVTQMVLGPVEGYQPDPGQVKVRRGKKRRGDHADPWDHNVANGASSS